MRKRTDRLTNTETHKQANGQRYAELEKQAACEQRGGGRWGRKGGGGGGRERIYKGEKEIGGGGGEKERGERGRYKGR